MKAAEYCKCDLQQYFLGNNTTLKDWNERVFQLIRTKLHHTRRTTNPLERLMDGISMAAKLMFEGCQPGSGLTLTWDLEALNRNRLRLIAKDPTGREVIPNLIPRPTHTLVPYDARLIMSWRVMMGLYTALNSIYQLINVALVK